MQVAVTVEESVLSLFVRASRSFAPNHAKIECLGDRI